MVLSVRDHTKKFDEIDKGLYQAMKVAAKKRKIKLSAQHDLYKNATPYFYTVFYSLEWIREFPIDHVDITLEISVKYSRFDELYDSIVNPRHPVHFTDKIRANSGTMFYRPFPRFIQSFPFEGRDEALPQLCEDILDFLKQYYRDFFQRLQQEYGNLIDYYIAERDKDPFSAGLAYLDRGDTQSAAECFSHPAMERLRNAVWSVDIKTKEQEQRAKSDGTKVICVEYEDGTVSKCLHRRQKNQFIDYAFCLKNRLEWTHDRAMYGLLPEEREK